ncbi:prealbumin-like fold domain-containing protein [Streptomyces albipurpureus]|uniref:Prealbumin-like fold domain-containing protein n=1 Tax=Streptomyces albipurpureus TaxID=2897419 RepID=A0ABT0UFJ6_9ACTN|nr:prealbumin-like fold domain-containing protein [Streptomyces sp. CWNU-1]MCM2387402.1 prealbumin-like fold domain-containing protein [Streptomyces sp. CWNU-1]
MDGDQRHRRNPDPRVSHRPSRHRDRQRLLTGRVGACVFRSLAVGEYYVLEPPKGYVLPDNPVSGPYEITAENADLPVAMKIANKSGSDEGKKGKY